MRYNASATDQYMLSVLVDEFTVDEADNALTALTALTNTYPSLFPFERTFARPDHQRGVEGPAGVRFVVYGDEGIVRFVRLPRESLASVESVIDALYEVVEGLTRTAA